METVYDAVTEANKEEFVALIEDICSNLSATDVAAWRLSNKSWANHFYIESSNDEFISLYLMNCGYATKAMQNRIKISSSCPSYLREFVRTSNSPKDITVTERAMPDKIADVILKKFLPDYRKAFADWNLHYTRTMATANSAKKKAEALSNCLGINLTSDSYGNQTATGYTTHVYTKSGSLKIKVTEFDVYLEGYISEENAKVLLNLIRTELDQERKEKKK